MSEYSYEGCNYGSAVLSGKMLEFSSKVTDKTLFELDLSKINQCVVPTNNAQDLELQFGDAKLEKNADCLVSITFHFPTPEEKEGEDGENEEIVETDAQKLKSQIMAAGLLKSSTGDVVIEFTKDEGNFTFPRGKYALQFTSKQLVMQGGQYSYRIDYTNIEIAYMLNKTEKDRVAFVLQLHTPIRQGNQKYKCLVLETHNLEETKMFNLPVEILEEKYNINSQELQKPMSHIFGKVLKDVGGVKIVVPKAFQSSTNAPCVRCSIKANDGYLYPAAKCLIFITKPTLIINIDDIESIEFLRYDNTKNAATRNFEMQIKMKSSNDKEKEKEYTFAGIYRAEYLSLHQYVESKGITIDNPHTPSLEGLDDEGEEDEDEEDDGDYKSGSGGSGSDSDDDSSGDSGSESGSGSESEKDKKSKNSKSTSKKPSVKKETSSKKRKSEPEKDSKKKKPKKEKDPNAPKRATTPFMVFSNAVRAEVKKENPQLSFGELGKEIGNRWKALSAEEKAQYEDIATKDKLRYQQELKAYKSKGGEVEEEGEEGEEEEA